MMMNSMGTTKTHAWCARQCLTFSFVKLRLTDEGMKALTRPLLDQTASPNRLQEFSAAGCSLLTNEVCSAL